MGEDEKAAQVGQAVLLLQARRRELAHLAEKIERVRAAYRKFAAEPARWRADHAGGVSLARPDADERDLGAHLLNQRELARLVAERDQARQALDEAAEKLRQFGVSL